MTVPASIKRIADDAQRHADMMRKAMQPIMPPIPALMAQTKPLPEIPRSPLVTNVEANYASEFHKRLVKWVSDFDASLDEEHEVGARLVSFGQTVIFHLSGIGYWNPSLIIFHGDTDAGEPVQLIQHVSQISILLMTLPRTDPSKPRRWMGFHDGRGDGD